MDQTQFVNALRSEAADAGVEDVLSQWTRPSGRFPSDERRKRSEWFAALGEEDQAMIRLMVEDAARASLFGALCILDGVRSIGLESSRLELRLVRSDGDAKLLASNGFEEPILALHELL